jgi:hypothetical protein
MSEITSCGCNIINLLLPTIKTCSAGVIHPLVDKIVYEGALADVEERLVAVKAIMFGANMGKQDLINQLTTRLADVTEYDDTTLIGRVQAVQALVDLLPDCN